MSSTSRRPPTPVLRRVLATLCCAVLLTSCNVPRTDQAQPASPSPADSQEIAPTPTPTLEPQSTPEPSNAASPATEPGTERLVSDGVRLERLENNGGRTLATVTNLNSLPVEVQMSIDIWQGGEVPNFSLRGEATLDSEQTGSVLLEEEKGQPVDCSGGCSYDLEVDAQVADVGEAPGDNETSCTPAVCSLDPEPSGSPSG